MGRTYWGAWGWVGMWDPTGGQPGGKCIMGAPGKGGMRKGGMTGGGRTCASRREECV